MHLLSRLFAYPIARLLTLMRWLALLALTVGMASPALAVKTYSDNGDGTVTDPTTGLTWMRCPVGQAWSGSTCTGITNTYTWDEASILTESGGGQSNWRLPNIRELQSLVDWTRYNPALNPVTFPANSNMLFWSSTVDVYNSAYAWQVDFHYGVTTTSAKSHTTYQARLVRGGHSLDLLSETRSDSDYTDNGDGTVTHKPTGLMWKQCSEGQTWIAGSGCSGSTLLQTSQSSNWIIAAYAGSSDWRMPSVDELSSLGEYTIYGAAVNPTLFPNTPLTYSEYCTSTNLAFNSGVWTVDSYRGAISNYNSYCSARLVRAGVTLATATPSAPSIGIATSSDASATVGFAAPIYDGGLRITGYTVISNPAGGVDSDTGTTVLTHTITGLANGTAYTFTVKARNSYGEGPSSGASSSITPKANQSIGVISFTPATLAVGGTSTASATGGASGNAVTFTSSTPGTCTVSGSNGSIVTGLTAGTCTLVANQDGDTIYASAKPVTQDFTVDKASQVISPISFTPATLAVGGTSTASATGGASGNAVTFTSSTPGTCAVSGSFGSIVTGVSVGACAVTANQPENANYLAAAPVTQSITVAAGPAISLNPTSLSFGEQHMGSTSVAKTMVVSNSGGGPLVISGIAVTVNPGDFAVTGCSGANLAAGASCNLSVTFSPTAVGGRIATIQFTSNASNSGQVNLDGIGVASNVPICTLTAAPGRIAPGRSSTLTANCSPIGATLIWTGVPCAGTTAATCVVTPAATSTYSVTGTNGSDVSNPVSTTVTVKSVDLTPILMLLLD